MKLSIGILGLVGLMFLGCNSLNDSSGTNNGINNVESNNDPITLENLTSDLSRFTGLSEGLNLTDRTLSLQGATESGTSGDSAFIIVVNSMGETRTRVNIDPTGRYDQAVELADGENTVYVVVYENGEIIESAKVDVNTNMEVSAARVRLEWKTDENDVDLYIEDPNGDESWYINKVISSGALDIDDTDGFGPETFTFTNPMKGNYIIRVNYFATNGISSNVSTTVKLSLNDEEWNVIGQHNFVASEADAGETFWYVDTLNICELANLDCPDNGNTEYDTIIETDTVIENDTVIESDTSIVYDTVIVPDTTDSDTTESDTTETDTTVTDTTESDTIALDSNIMS